MNLLNSNQNIILTWMPWCWKSTLWCKLAFETGANFSDFDDDILEKIDLETSEKVISILNLKSHWIIPEKISNQKVSDLLKLLWDDNFLELEWFIWENLNFNEKTIISTSWSLPLKTKAMDHLRKKWKVIHIDTPIKSILERLEQMKTNRIIWMWKMTLEEILEYRKDFYNKTMDYNFEVQTFKNTDLWVIQNKINRDIQKNIIFNDFINFLKSK